jgi:DNA-binding IclR family transcriptional regulator
MPLASAHRLCADLVAAGALSRRDSGEYVIGRRLWTTGMLAPVQTGLRDLAAPFLHDIHAATRATVHLAVRDGTEVLYLDRVSGGDSAPVVSRIGGRLPLHCTGVGKVLLAHAPTAVTDTVLADLRRSTPFTVVQAAVLTGQLERIRRDGYATTVDEMTVGASSVAVPITRATSTGPRVVAALGLVVVHLRRDRPRLVAALDVAARGIGRLLVPAD